MASKVSGYIGKINPGNGTQYSLGSTAYGYCETEAATAAKTVDMTGFILTEGATIFIKFKYNNTATDDPTLNVATTGAKPLIPKTWYAGAILSLTYDGTSWVQANAYLDASTITSGTLPVTQGGTGNTSYDANRVIYSESASKLSATGHYASASKLAINSTAEPDENFYVEGTSRFSLGTSNTTSAAKKFIIGSSDTSYLSFGTTGIQAYDNTNTESTLNLNYYNGNIQMGRSSDSTTTNLILFGTLYLCGSAASATKPGPGKISWYGAYGGDTNYTWYDYVSNATDGMCPTGGKPSTPENVTGWAKRSLITGAQNYGWVWEAASNAAAASTATQPTAIFSISSENGRALLNTSTTASNSNAPSLRVVQNTEIPKNAVNHMAQFLAPNMVQGGANALVLGKAVSLNQAGGLMYTYGGTAASSLAFGFVNNLGLLKITSSGSIYINSGSSSTHNTNTSELLVKGRVVVDPSYHNTNSFSEFRINRSTAGWSAITLGGAQGTTSGGGLGVWLIGNKNTPNDATTAAAGITDSQFYISYNKSATADCRIQGHNADGFSIRPRLAVNANVNTDYSLYVNGTSLFFGRVISNTAATDAIVVEHGTANKNAGVTVRRTDINTAVWMGVGASGTYGLYSPALTSWMIYGDNSGVHVNGNAATATAANLTTTANAIAYYTNTTGTFGTKASANGALYATAANGALQWGTLPVAQGGTGATTAAAARANLGTLGSKLVGSFEGMTTMSGDDTKWIRTTTVGIIPYENGGAGSGHSALGTATWYFADAYVDHMHGVDIVTNQAGAGQGLQIQSNSKRVAQLYLYTRGTTSVTGSAQFILGNNIATGTAENAAGMIQIHGTNTGYHRIQPTASTSNYNHYLPNAKGWIATGGNGTSTGVGSASQPVYLSSAGVLTACQIDANIAVISYAGTGTDSVTLEFPFAPTIVIACGGGAIVDASSGWSGVHSNGVAGAGSLICAMAKVPVAASISAVANNDTYGTNSVGKGLAYVVGKIESALPDTKYTSCIGKSSNGKKLFIKWFGAAPGPVGSAGAAYIFNLSGNTYHFLAIK